MIQLEYSEKSFILSRHKQNLIIIALRDSVPSLEVPTGDGHLTLNFW